LHFLILNMKAIRSHFAALLVLALCLSLAHAATYIEPNAVDVAKLLPPPPADDSPAGRADLETVLQVQADRTPAQLARAARVAPQTAFTFAVPVLGENFTSANLPRTTELLKEILTETRVIVLAAKARWDRTRPYLREAGVEPSVARPKNSSYPSGHSADAAIWAGIFAAAFPEYAKALDREVHEVMWSRVLGGAHYPSDTEAGKIFGDAIVQELLKNPTTKRAIAEIRAEGLPHIRPLAKAS
jgi:acid phosphatase (class A)